MLQSASLGSILNNHMGKSVAIIGGGPAGLMAAQAFVDAGGDGRCVTIYDAMPTPGRKFLMAGKSGLNLTHSEDYEIFRSRYKNVEGADHLLQVLDNFTPDDVVAFAEGLGVETFVGSSGRVFPKVFKAAPMLRAWLKQLSDFGVRLKTRHRWCGWRGDKLLFQVGEGEHEISADVVILALGGASWPRLGSDGSWASFFADKQIEVDPFKPSNCGFVVDWSPHFLDKFAGDPVKSVVVKAQDGMDVKGDFVISRKGIEGSAVYAISSALVAALDTGPAYLEVDLLPDRSQQWLADKLAAPRGKKSLANHIRKSIGIEGVKAGLLRELVDRDDYNDPLLLAAKIKALFIPLKCARPIEEAISTSGGLAMSGINHDWMLTAKKGVFVAGEMLNWDAPTGGYLLTACFASGKAAGQGAYKYFKSLKAD